jgi:predicted transcriptional regulator
MSDIKIEIPRPIDRNVPIGKKGKYKTKYSPEIAKLAQNLWAAGFSDARVARNLGIAPPTLVLWKSKYPEIKQAYINGKDGTITDIFNAMKQRALDGDVKAGEFLLKKLASDIYGDKKTIEVTGEIQVKDRSDAELLEIIERGKAIEAEVMQIEHEDVVDAEFEDVTEEE